MGNGWVTLEPCLCAAEFSSPLCMSWFAERSLFLPGKNSPGACGQPKGLRYTRFLCTVSNLLFIWVMAVVNGIIYIYIYITCILYAYIYTLLHLHLMIIRYHPNLYIILLPISNCLIFILCKRYLLPLNWSNPNYPIKFSRRFGKKHLSPSLSESNSKSPWKLAGWEVCFPFSVWFLNDVDVHLSLHPAKTCANTRSVNWFHLSFEFRTAADFEVKLLLSRELFFFKDPQSQVMVNGWFGAVGGLGF